jgi:hypothetical protein
MYAIYRAIQKPAFYRRAERVANGLNGQFVTVLGLDRKVPTRSVGVT